MHLALMTSLAFALLTPAALAAARSKGEAVAIGPWQVEAAYKNPKIE
ncbi:hypothetical protein [Methylobacterium sp. WL64]|nr:hypothetical protein [Methylobacterium sp. WL64]